MPTEWRQRLQSIGLDAVQIEILLDAQIELSSDFLSLIEAHIDDKERAKIYANWIINTEVPFRRDLIEKDQDITVSEELRSSVYGGTYDLVIAGKLNSNKAVALLSDLLASNTVPDSFETYAEQNTYIQVSDEGEIAKIVTEVLSANAKAADDVKNGEMKAIGFLVGQVMKQSQGKANPQLAQELIKKQLGI
jgi:aspartyl-tRNA(Asn)/glutamyl-tRNA(Gln) amidotransferase subunit B